MNPDTTILPTANTLKMTTLKKGHNLFLFFIPRVLPRFIPLLFIPNQVIWHKHKENRKIPTCQSKFLKHKHWLPFPMSQWIIKFILIYQNNQEFVWQITEWVISRPRICQDWKI